MTGSVLAVTLLAAFVAIRPGDEMSLAQTQIPLTIGQIGEPSIYDAAQVVARKEELYDKEGVKVEIKTATSIESAREMVNRGEVDVVRLSSRLALNWILDGVPVRVVSASTPIADYVVVGRPGLALKDLSGREIVVRGMMAPDALLVRSVAGKEGIDIRGTKFLESRTEAERIAMLKGPGVSFGIVSIRELVLFQSDPILKDFRPVFTLGDAVASFDFGYDVAHVKSIQERPAAVEGFVAGTIRGARMVAERPELAVRRLREESPALARLDEKMLIDAISIMSKGGTFGVKGGVFGVNGGLNKDTFDFTVQLYPTFRRSRLTFRTPTR